MENIYSLKAMMNRDTFYRYSPVLYKLPNQEKEVKLILKSIGSYYDTFPEQDIIKSEELQVYFFQQNPKIQNKDFIQQIFNSIKQTKIHNDKLLKEHLTRLVIKHTHSLITADTLKGLENPTTESLDIIMSRIDDANEMIGRVGDAERDVDTTPAEEIWRKMKGIKYTWRLAWLRKTLGSPQLGRLGHVFAPSETGKSTWMLSEMTYFAQQMIADQYYERPILYIVNEGDIAASKQRLLSSYYGLTVDELEDKGFEVLNRAYEEIQRVVKPIGDKDRLTDVEGFIKWFNPLLCFIDMGTNLKPFRSNEMKITDVLTTVFEKLRSLAVRYQTSIISVGQSDDKSRGQKWLGMNRMHESKVGVPGALDWAMGIGYTEDEGLENHRYLYVCKNKMRGIHDKYTCLIDKPRSRYIKFA